MGDPAIEFHGRLVLLIERVAVLGAAIPPRSGLPATCREEMRSLDIANVAVLKYRVNAGRVRAEQLGQLRAPAQSLARFHRMTELVLGGEPLSDSAGDPADRVVQGPS